MDDRIRSVLPEPHRRLHRELINAMIAGGAVPGMADLAAGLGVTVEEVGAGLHALADADYLWLDASGRISCLYPFSAVPTPHVVVIGQERRYAMCALDALGVAAMLGQAVGIEGRCAVCGAPLRLLIRPGGIDLVDPPAMAVVARREKGAPACEVCCPFTVFACGPDHARQVAGGMPQSEMLRLVEAQSLGEGIFGDLLGETLPARRRRSSDVATGQRSTNSS